MSRWFRHYAGMMRDDKLVRAALKAKQSIERVVWVWGAILESAAELNNDGQFEVDAAEIAYFLHADEDDVLHVLAALETMGRLDGGRVVKWRDRQFQSDSSAERQRRYRDKRKTSRDISGDAEKLASDADVTSPSRHGDAPETETETDRTSSLRSDVPRTKPTKAVRIPPDFAPDLDEAQRIGLTPAEARTEAETFVDYWTAKGAGGAKLDWPATWRVWCRNTIKRRPTGPPARQNRTVNGFAALALKMAANEPDRQNRPDQASGTGPRPQQGDAYPRLLDAEQPRRTG